MASLGFGCLTGFDKLSLELASSIIKSGFRGLSSLIQPGFRGKE
ncbi:hypothetical protein DsansV1_C06g0064491 [Dioscorea sansibarensis]